MLLSDKWKRFTFNWVTQSDAINQASQSNVEMVGLCKGMCSLFKKPREIRYPSYQFECKVNAKNVFVIHFLHTGKAQGNM